MIFLGDIASPNRDSNESLNNFFEANQSIFEGNKIIFNLEGLLANRSADEDNKPVLFNHFDLPNKIKKSIDPVFCLANNHILDLPNEFDNTIAILQKEKIPYCGAGKSMKEALEPIRFYEDDKEILLFNACWDFLLYSQRNPEEGVYVAEIKEMKLLNQVVHHREVSPNANIVVYLHWSLDLENLPFPMYRQFSKDLIDNGVNLVVGTHSHCLQGGEKYKDGYVLYGLGNFFIPGNIFAGGKLRFPDFANVQLALEWNTNTNEVICHWLRFHEKDGKFNWEFIKSEKFETSGLLKDCSPYIGMNEKVYLKYFKDNRRKKILIPIYKNYKHKRRNAIYTRMLRTRAKSAHFLAKLRFIKWQN